MARYSSSREKFPFEQKFKGTAEHRRRIILIAAHYDIPQQEAIRRAVDCFYLLLLFLSRGSVDRSDRQNTQKEPTP